MQLVERVIEYSGRQVFTIHVTGDTHIGTVHHDRTRWLRDIRIIENNPRALWLHVGDTIEAISPDDFRWAGAELAPEFAA